jgi:hypothetical protein
MQDKVMMPPPSTPPPKNVYKQIKIPEQRYSLSSPNLNRTPSTPTRTISPMSLSDYSVGDGVQCALPKYKYTSIF